MKIALVLPAPPAYSETFFRSKIKGLKENGHEVILITAKSRSTFDLCSHRTHPKVYSNKLVQVGAMFLVGLSLLPYWRCVKNYYRLEKKEKTSVKRIIEKIYINATLLKLEVDWLHFGFATMALERELVAKAIKAKMAVSFRGYDINVYPLKHAGCYKKLWQQVDKVHSISEFLIQKAYALGLATKTNYKIIPPAVNFSQLTKLNENSTPTTKINIVTIARLQYIKGIDMFLQTAEFLKKQQLDFNWYIIGDGKAADKERYLYHRYEAGLENEVHFLGELTHTETLKKLSQATIYVQTSLNEGFCNAVLEAQALGKISVAFNTGALKENIIDGNTGFLVKVVTPTALAREIIKVLNLPSLEKKIITQQARERVKNSFTLQQQKEAFNFFYS